MKGKRIRVSVNKSRLHAVPDVGLKKLARAQEPLGRGSEV